MIKSKLNVETIFFSMYNIKESIKKIFSILFRKLVLTNFIAENARSIVAIETGRVSKNFTILGNMHYAFNYKFSISHFFSIYKFI